MTPGGRRTSSSQFSYRSHPHLYEINTWVWLEELSAREGRRLRLQDVPEEEWDRLADLGFDFIYLMGVWHRSRIGRRIFRNDPKNFSVFDTALPRWRMADVVGSPFSIQNYIPDPHITTAEGLMELHDQLRRRGMGLILDFVPNHTGFDHCWIAEHPKRYILGSEEDFRRDPAAFYLVEREDDENLFIARGRDPYFAPWDDVAQLNYFNPDCRKGMTEILTNIAQYCDGVRCDMAMLVTNEIFGRTWGSFLKSWPMPTTEFWVQATGEMRDFVWLAEVYWDLEWKMQQMGFKFTYDKRLYDRLREGSSGEVRAHLSADLGYQGKLARFLENHDEPRAAATFSHEKITSVATLVSTLPGMRFYHQGQLSGAKTFVPMPLGRARSEKVDQQIRDLYERCLGLADQEVFHAGEWQLLEVLPAGDETFQDLVAYRWHFQTDSKLIVVNLSGRTVQGNVQKVLSPINTSEVCLFCDLLNGSEYKWERSNLESNGLYVRLEPYQAHAFELRDASDRFRAVIGPGPH